MELSRFESRAAFLGLDLGAWLLGIALHSIWPFWHTPDFCLALILTFCAMACAVLRERRRLRVVSTLLLIVALGFWRFNLTLPQNFDGVMPSMGRTASFQGKILSQGKMRNLDTIIVAVQRSNGAVIRGPGSNVSLSLKSKAPEIGSVVSFACRLRVPLTFPSNLDRRRSLAHKGVWSECTAAVAVQVVSPADNYDPLVVLARWRNLITARIKSVLPTDEAELTTGILYGDQDLSASMKDLFQRAGLMHLVAVSGSNVTIVVSVLLGLVLALGFSRRQGFWIVSGGLLAFVGFVGFGASVLRAAVMGWLVILARHVGRLPSTGHLLLLAAAFLNLCNPWLLAFDPGFALSFLATWGLLAWTPLVNRKLKFVPNVLSCRESLACTCGATLMTAPYMAWIFGYMSLAGLLTNALALPLVPWTMSWGAVCAAWGNWFGSSVISLPALGLARLIIWISHLADYVPWLDLHLPCMDVFLLFASYGMLLYWWHCLTQEPETQKQVVDRSDNHFKMS